MHDADAAQRRPHVLIVCDYFPPATRAGGPAKSLRAIARGESNKSSITVLTRDRDLGSELPYEAAQLKAVESELPDVLVVRIPMQWQALRLARSLRREARRTDLVYLNSLVSPRYTLLPLILFRLRLVPARPILLAPRGELARGALEIKATKKRLALPIIRHLLSKLPVTWHASSPREAADITAFLCGLSQRVIVRANPAPPVSGEPLIDFGENSFTIAFVGRMVPIKNFLLVARAVLSLTFRAHVIVAGAIEDTEYWTLCQKVTDSWPAHVTLDVRGHVSDDDVTSILQKADVMVLPTRGENFGRAIAESLSVGCPVLIPDTTLWTRLLAHGAGWTISADDPAPLAAALEAYASTSAAEKMVVRQTVRDTYAAWWIETQSHERLLFTEALAAILDDSESPS